MAETLQLSWLLYAAEQVEKRIVYIATDDIFNSKTLVELHRAAGLKILLCKAINPREHITDADLQRLCLCEIGQSFQLPVGKAGSVVERNERRNSVFVLK